MNIEQYLIKDMDVRSDPKCRKNSGPELLPSFIGILNKIKLNKTKYLPFLQ